MSADVYLWINRAVEKRSWHDPDDIPNHYMCVDEGESDPKLRYGYFDGLNEWHHTPLEDFPREFRTALLLLGVN